MDNDIISRGSERNKKNRFDPSREFLQQSVDEYLRNGGTIKQLTLPRKKGRKKKAIAPSKPYVIKRILQRH